MSEKWHKHGGYVYCYAEANQPNNGTEDSVIDVEQEHKKAREEEEQGKMQEEGQCFNCPGKVKLIDTLREKCTNPTSLMWVLIPVCPHECSIMMCPLSQHRRQQGTHQADDQAQEPEQIDPHSIMRWGECGWVGKHGRD